MATIRETVSYVRSKNAGPFWLTMDLFCDNETSYNRLVRSPNLSKSTIAKIYQIPETGINIFYLPNLRVVKISFPRMVVQGSPFDRDMHGGQQYIPLLDLEL